MMFGAHQVLRRMGYPGFVNQIVVELAGRIDVTPLRRAIDRLCHRYPVLAARIVPDGLIRWAYWSFRPGEVVDLHEADLDAPGRDPVMAYAQQILAIPFDLSRENPASFHLLHSPDGRDTLILHFEHAVMDSNALDSLILELDSLIRCDDHADPPPAPEPDDIRNYLKRFPFRTRLSAIFRTRTDPPPWRNGPAVTLVSRTLLLGPRPYRIAFREVPASTLAAVNARITKACGYPNLSMGLLASIFRAILEHVAEPPHRFGRLITHIGFNLRPPDEGDTTSVRNIATVMPIDASIDEAADRDGLLKTLSRRLRDRLKRQVDLGLLQLVYWHSRRIWFVRFPLKTLFMKRQSLNYGCFNSIIAPGATFAGVPIEAAYHVASTSSPPGLSLLANRFQGRLLFTAVYVPDAVPPSRMEAFLDRLISDFTA